jgi:serine/threonine protein phosphatase PrpC
MVFSSAGRTKFSFASVKENSRTFFNSKATRHMGDRVDFGHCGLGFACRRGLKPSVPNQDSFMALRVEGDFSLYGVFDGHGLHGHEVSNFVKETLPKLILRDPRFSSRRSELPAVCRDAFRQMQTLIVTADKMNKLNSKWSGTTCTVAIHDHCSNRLTVAHVADSTCVIGRYRDGESNRREFLEALQLTRDHKPDLDDERERIEEAGGTVEFDGYANHRVYITGSRCPGLNMSRCLGDLMGHDKCGLSAEPEIYERNVGLEDHLLLLCSDGVWEFMTPAEAVAMVGEFPAERATHASECLAREARDRWLREEGGDVVDDITVVAVHLQRAAQASSHKTDLPTTPGSAD